MAPTLGDWVNSEYRKRYCNNLGILKFPINWDNFTKQLVKLRPKQAPAIADAVARLREPPYESETDGSEEYDSETDQSGSDESEPDMTLDAWVHRQYLAIGFTEQGFVGWTRFKKQLKDFKPKNKKDINETVRRLRENQGPYHLNHPDSVVQARVAKRGRDGRRQDVKTQESQPTQHTPEASRDDPAELRTQSLGTLPSKIEPFADTSKIATFGVKVFEALKSADTTSQVNQVMPYGNGAVRSNDPLSMKRKDLKHLENAHVSIASVPEESPQIQTFSHSHAFGTDSNQFRYPLRSKSSENTNKSSKKKLGLNDLKMPEVSTEQYYGSDSELYDLLLADDVDDVDDENDRLDQPNTEIRHAPVVSGDILKNNCDLLPQYGLLGSEATSGDKMFQNTNVPFSSFICGVQGSGKSHTTSCMLENALIPSRHLGRLEKPLSGLVFAYDDFSSDGSGFSVSEVAHLAAPHSAFPKHPSVKKITVLVSPSNPVIARIYSRLPNVTVVPFKLNPRSLTINTILTLMAVDESETIPLYLAQLTKILRDINVKNNGYFDYHAFRKQLKKCNFNPAQEAMLQLRLDLLESFLDLTGKAPQPTFRPGEITIMDMSCPFVDANTACILFKIGLERYLESDVPGKMVVLDEAHKYMLRVPGAHDLNAKLIKMIRLQRHQGTRIIISTQEPTLLTDLIALCSVTVIHRFSSPEWFAALQKHIPMSGQNHDKLLREIEGLKTGTALVYSPNAVLKRDEEGCLVKGLGRLIKVRVRKRVTSDGGQSILAV